MKRYRSAILHRPRRTYQGRRRRGIAVVLVLGLLAITLAISYATLHGQGVTSQLAQNNGRALDARMAAQSGLAAALRKISENAWPGVDVPISANVTNHSWYQVTFTTGDAKLTNTNPQYNEFPFRLTIDAVGYAADPENAAIRSEHHSRCIVQLMRKRLTAEPTNWATVTGNTVYQYDDQNVTVQFPVRINGTATLMGKLAFFCTDYPGNTATAARDQYLSDLNARRIAGLGDYRPFPGVLTIRGIATTQDATTMALLMTKLGMVLVEPTLGVGAPVNHPGTVAGYKLYPGGKTYTPPILQNNYGNPIQNVTLAPDPVNNPLGIYRSSGALSVQGNVRITGTIITDGTGAEIQVYGTSNQFQPYNLPSLYGSAQTYQLPTAMVQDGLRINSGAGMQIGGAVVVWDEFRIKNGLPSTSFSLTGDLITKKLTLEGRSTWTQTAATWTSDKTQFSLQLLGPSPILYFPDYMENKKGFVVKPTLTFSSDSSGVKPHWHDWSQAIYQPDPADPGLKWEVVRWEDNL